MKKAVRALAALLAVILLISGVSLSVLAQDYTPNTPINYGKISDALFKSVSLSTGTNTYAANDNWKYYYWCDFTPQYSAEYSAVMDAIRPVGVEIYDENEKLLSGSKSNGYDDDKRCRTSASYYMEKGKTYYFKLFFTGGHYDSCGPFNVILKSGGSPDFPGGDSLVLYVGGSIFQTVYELPEYSFQRVFKDLSLLTVFEDGSYFKWENSESTMLSIRGVDIILDMSDCTSTLGTHTVRVHYMGYEATASYEIVECVHNYKESYVSPSWLSRAYSHFECTKCGKSYDGDYTLNGSEIYAGFENYFSAFQKEKKSLNCTDLDNDGTVSIRDYSLTRSLYNDAEKEFFTHFASSKGSGNYDPDFDINSDGNINIRDYSLLKKSKPKDKNG